MAFLELTNVRKIFPNAQAAAVENFNLAVERGEFVSFLGPSGCGKTTTLRMVAGFEVPTSGSIVMDGHDITGIRPNQRNIGMVFQSYALFPNMTVADNIGFGLSVAAHAQSRHPAAGQGDAGADQAGAAGRALSVPAFGRPAAARGAGARAGHSAAAAAARRAAVGARRQDSRLAAQRDSRHSAPVGHHHDLRHARPGRGAVALRPRGGHESGRDRAGRATV